MKTNYYFIMVSFIFCTSCQERYSDVMIQQQLLWNETIQRSNEVLKKDNFLAIREVKAYTKLMTQYHSLYPKFKYITTLADSAYNDIERLKQELIEDSEDYASIARIAPTKTLRTSIQSVYDNYLHLMEIAWDSGGIKGTIFADISKKESLMQEIKEKLNLPFISQIRQDSTQLERQLKGKPLAAVLTLLSSVQNDIRKQESHAFHFFARQVGRLCNFGWSSGFGFRIRPNSFCIRLGETFETEIIWGSVFSKTVQTVTINEENLPLIDTRAIYTIQPSQIGKQTYRPTVTFLNPYTNTIDSLEKTFYFDVLY